MGTKRDKVAAKALTGMAIAAKRGRTLSANFSEATAERRGGVTWNQRPRRWQTQHAKD